MILAEVVPTVAGGDTGARSRTAPCPYGYPTTLLEVLEAEPDERGQRRTERLLVVDEAGDGLQRLQARRQCEAFESCAVGVAEHAERRSLGFIRPDEVSDAIAAIAASVESDRSRRSGILRAVTLGVALRLTGSSGARPKPQQAREWRRCSQQCGRQTPRPAAAPRSLRSADPLCTATWSVLSLSMTYCGSSLEARTV